MDVTCLLYSNLISELVLNTINLFVFRKKSKTCECNI